MNAANGRRSRHLGVLSLVLTSLAGGACPAPSQTASDVELCAEAERFMVDELRMVAVTEPDTIQDWRTRQTLAGCRVTAAGVTELEGSPNAELFYQRLRENGWTRTPDPVDAPGEASLRFRAGAADCVFNVYDSPLLGTPAEMDASRGVVPAPGERRYHVLALCMPAIDLPPG